MPRTRVKKRGGGSHGDIGRQKRTKNYTLQSKKKIAANDAAFRLQKYMPHSHDPFSKPKLFTAFPNY